MVAEQIGINRFAISKTNKLVIIVICITDRLTGLRANSGVIQSRKGSYTNS